MADYDLYFGIRVSYGALFDSIKNFFDEGGNQCYVARVVGSGATSGTLTIQDQVSGAPLDTLRIDAASAGGWSSNLAVIITAGLANNTFRMQVVYEGSIVEDYNNLVSPAMASLKFAQSAYVVVTDLGSTTQAPNNNPALINATNLSTGTDDRGSVVSANYVTALSQFGPGLGDGAVSIPGVGPSIFQGVIDHCSSNDRIAILASTRGAAPTDLRSTVGTINSEYAGLFAPWILVSDGAGGQRAISPEGYVAADRSRAIAAAGPWRAPAGLIGQARTIIGLDQNFSLTDANNLDDAGVSCIRVINNSIRLYGWRSVSSNTDDYRMLSSRDLLNYLEVRAGRTLEDYVFQTIDGKGQLLSSIQAALVGMVDPVAQAGGLYALYDDKGVQIDPGYRVDTSSAINTIASLATDTVNALMLVRISPTGAMIKLQIVKVSLLSGV